MIDVLPASVTVTDITLRDGLQSLPAVYATADKRAIYDAVLGAGFTSIEVTAFMRPDRVPHGPPWTAIRRLALIEYSSSAVSAERR